MLETPNGSLFLRCYLLLFTTDGQDRKTIAVVQAFYSINQAGNLRCISEEENIVLYQETD